MNPVRGIETFRHSHTLFEALRFQINESRSRDWNRGIDPAYKKDATTFKLMNPVRGIET